MIASAAFWSFYRKIEARPRPMGTLTMQKKIEDFFAVTICHSQTIKKCFVYDPSIPCATFVYEPLDTDQFLSTESGVKMYYRPSHSSQYSFPIMGECPAPLLISNLQKAIRRQDAEIAVQSALALAQQHPTKLLRRLPIIYIEDVTLMDSLPIVVWWMMAVDYRLTSLDTEYLLNIVNSLASHDAYYENDRETEQEPDTHEQLQDHHQADALLALLYRSKYGGMKGDMRMLVNAIQHFKEHPMEPTVYYRVHPSKISLRIEILMEAIDFHPFPQLLAMIQQKTKLDQERIKTFIWHVESGVNVRKSTTLEQARAYQERWEWRVISKFLDAIRRQLVS
jgi:hypothetical protein